MNRRFGLGLVLLALVMGCGDVVVPEDEAVSSVASALTVADVLGGYDRLPIENDWHPGEITETATGLVWTNDAGVSWALTPDLANDRLLTGPDCPYAGWPNADAFTLEYDGVELVGFRFQGELYVRRDASEPPLPDEVDDMFTDSNGDGVDGTASALVFVAPVGVDHGACGTRESPCRSINYGIARASAEGFDVAVSAGAYQERVVLVNGVSVHGGYSHVDAWARAATNVVTIVAAPTQIVDGRVEGVFASGLTQRTILDRVVVQAGSSTVPPSVAGTSVYGVRVVSSSALVIKNVIVTSGIGANGSVGANGAGGERGANGASASGRTGGFGAAGWCGSNLVPEWAAYVRGGTGGQGGADSAPNACWGGGNGTAGSWLLTPPAWAAGCGHGQGGTGADACGYANASPGTNGMSCGQNGQAGPGGYTSSLRGAVSGASWTPAAGVAGQGRGTHGRGGAAGGGGGSGNSDAFGGAGANGGGGGGGGAGGCGGYPGGAGTGGGGSFALFVVDASIEVVASTFASARGGHGGNGGHGGVGGVGGAGGNGAGGSASSGLDARSSAAGGYGGPGSYGGPGGGAAGGPAGPSVAQLLCRSTAIGLSAATGTSASGAYAGPGGYPNGASGAASYTSALASLTGSCAL